MEFVELTHSVLRRLKKSGYTVLRSVTSVSSDDPTWVPERMDVDKLMELDSEEMRRMSVPMEEKHFLVIDDALNNIEEDNLIGQVLIV
ncbi:hypothetical protein [Sphingobacterium suaedae]|uniref:Uncharacterized protein n=1 Tax=Sphingobacterium suaedae TaxID=1686402 RepID=A0ABW5KIH7_9SPHI